jgi:hypothetical protein
MSYPNSFKIPKFDTALISFVIINKVNFKVKRGVPSVFREPINKGKITSSKNARENKLLEI